MTSMEDTEGNELHLDVSSISDVTSENPQTDHDVVSDTKCSEMGSEIFTSSTASERDFQELNKVMLVLMFIFVGTRYYVTRHSHCRPCQVNNY